MKTQYLTVGYITSTRGLKGVVRVKSTSYFASSRYRKGNPLFLFNEKENIRVPVIADTYSANGEFDYVSFETLNDINLVEKYIGWAIQVDRETLPPLPENTYYYSDLEGLECLDEEGTSFGEIVRVEDFTAQPSFRVRLHNSDRTVLIPYVEFFVRRISLETKTVTIHVIPGLLEQ